MNAADLAGTSSLTEVTKMEVDYSATCDQKIPEAEALAKTNLQEAIDMLVALEKQTRIVRPKQKSCLFTARRHV